MDITRITYLLNTTYLLTNIWKKKSTYKAGGNHLDRNFLDQVLGPLRIHLQQSSPTKVPIIKCWHLLLLTCHLEPDTAKVLHWTDNGLHSISKRTTSNALILNTCISHSSLSLSHSPFSLFLLSSSPSDVNTYIILPLLSSVSRGISARPGKKSIF